MKHENTSRSKLATLVSSNHQRQLLSMMLSGFFLIGGAYILLKPETHPEKVINLTSEDKMLIYKYRGIYGGALYISAVGEDKKNVTMLNQNGMIWNTKLSLGEGGARHSTFTDAMYIPRTLHVTWRTDDAEPRENSYGLPDIFRGFEGGTILGDYTVQVASRIPDEVLDFIRKNGSSLLRLKIRLADHAVLVGWDVEEWYTTKFGRRTFRYVMPGGDFREPQRENGEVIERGWMIMPDGQKVEMDWTRACHQLKSLRR
ncbi:hypothetical protein [Verminephrobacter aporrectodeae]|uniref:hypothetical protein n=2 Tax=Verminephrobacter aporrectodeae TaxID=1110389 RepID=UPI0022431500|nr:hypothetical protein [Verminephrobacter aporrectodeae]